MPNGLAVLAGGAAFVCDGVSYSTADLSPQVFYTTRGTTTWTPPPTMAPSRWPLHRTNFPDTTPDVFVFPPGATSFSSYSAAYTLESPTVIVAALGLSADSENLYAVIQNNDTTGDPVSFTVEALDARAMTTLTLSGPTSGTAHGRVTLTGQLTTLLTGTQAALPGAKVTITRTISGAGKNPVETLTATTAADGHLHGDRCPPRPRHLYLHRQIRRGRGKRARNDRRGHDNRPTWLITTSSAPAASGNEAAW